MLAKITTLVLNWNRARLLEQTLSSYIASVQSPWRLVIVDNASSDESRDVLQRFLSEYTAFAQAAGTMIELQLLDENRGGEGLNRALSKVSDGLVHITENDQFLEQGWCEHVRRSFSAFPNLGQLSLHAPVPSDDEAWVVKTARAILSDGALLYEAVGNVGTTSVIPASLFADGLRIRNLPVAGATTFKLPDDTKLSADIFQRRRLVAWSDRYWSRNLGHQAVEIARDPAYYQENYAAKPWLGQAGLAARVGEAARRPRPSRRSSLLPDALVQPEMKPGFTNGLSNQLWSMVDGVTPEIETLELVYGLVRAIKPRHAVETHTSFGHGALTISRALKANGFGHLTAFNAEPALTGVADEAIRISEFVDQITLLPRRPTSEAISVLIDFLVLNSAPDLQEADLFSLSPCLATGATLVCLGSPPSTTGSMSVAWQTFAVPRGLAIGTLRDPGRAQ